MADTLVSSGQSHLENIEHIDILYYPGFTSSNMSFVLKRSASAFITSRSRPTHFRCAVRLLKMSLILHAIIIVQEADSL